MGTVEGPHPTEANDSDCEELRVKCDEHGRVREIWLRECAGPVCEQGPGLSCVRVRVLACAGVSMRERVLGVRERVRGCTRACPPSCATRCPGCGGRMAGFLPTYANIHLARGFASGDGDLPHEEVRVYSSAHLERNEPRRLAARMRR